VSEVLQVGVQRRSHKAKLFLVQLDRVHDRSLSLVIAEGLCLQKEGKTEIDDWSLPKPYSCTTPACALASIEWVDGETFVTLPVVGAVGDPALLFVP
jgi:hypothetical protein